MSRSAHRSALGLPRPLAWAAATTAVLAAGSCLVGLASPAHAAGPATPVDSATSTLVNPELDVDGNAPVAGIGAPQTVVAPGGTTSLSGTIMRYEESTDGDDSGAHENLATLLFSPEHGLVRLEGAQAEALPTDAQVTVQVKSADRTDAVEVVGVQLAQGASVAAASGAASVQHVTMAFIAPKGAAQSSEYGPADAAALVDKVSTYWSTQTGNRVSVTLDRTVDWSTSTATCAAPQDLWNAAVASTGFTAGPDQHLVVVLPRGISGCSYGLGTIGNGVGSGGLVYVSDTSQSVLAHELGHNFGLGHANAVYPAIGKSTDVQYSSSTKWTANGSQYQEYGDVMDVMGYSDPTDTIGTGSLSGAHRAAMGDLFADEVTTVSSTGDVVLRPLGATSGAEAKVAKIVNGGAEYYLEYRKAVGADATTFTDRRNPAEGVRITRVDPASGGKASVVVDTSPSGTKNDWDWGLKQGQTFSTGDGRLHFTVSSLAGGLATVEVTFGNLPGTGPVVTVPGTPKITGLTRSGAQEITVKFAASTDKGGATSLTGFEVVPYVDGVADPGSAVTTAGTATTATFPNLVPGKKYSFVVRSQNSAGWSSASSRTSDVLVPLPLTRPGAPTGVTVAATGSDAKVTFTAPTDTGNTVLKAYRIVPVVDGEQRDASARTVAGNVTTATFTGLVGKVTFRVSAQNSVGWSDASADSGEHDFGTGVPGAPGVPTVVTGGTSASAATITVKWAAPTLKGAAALSGYVVTPSVGGVAQTPVSVSASTTSWTQKAPRLGEDYTFTVAAKNSYGVGEVATTASAANVAFRPAAVTAVAVTGVDKGNLKGTTATVTWKAPATDNGRAVTGYTVTAYAAGKVVGTVAAAADALGADVTGLTLGTSYTFGVVATNTEGDSPVARSAAVKAVDVPAAPTAVTATVAGSAAAGATVTVTWKAPTVVNGAPVSKYVVTPVVDGVAQAPVEAKGTSLVVKNVALGSPVTFTVAAVNVAGTGAASSASEARTPAFAPTAVTAVTTAYTGSGTTAGVSWTAPKTGGSDLLPYTVTAYLGGKVARTTTVAADATSAEFTGLTAGSSYVFGVKAANSIGSAAEVKSKALAVVDVPAQVATVTVVRGGTAARPTVTVSWKAPTTGGSAITGYELTPLDGTSGTATTVKSTSFTVPGVQLGGTYGYRVTAVNAKGKAPVSDDSATVTVAYLPGVVLTPATALTATSATVTWTAPADSGSAVTGYVVTPYANGRAQATLQATGTTVTVDDLTAGSWTFGVRAVNGVGTGAEVTTKAVVVR
ncbi:fibronectin type III domain-containing protein [Kineococcus rhizosphaerae]|uniref:Reprolysin-like metallo-peptidase family M12B n=1 Tax=Kineococcus rhizosphaerae TaxID=559628 RepID=A0A2T0R5N1_9ACTN|nr:fibronectin type III domain-containing protein [Kineococcus rhizosphaerae]PRY16069.1 reprolysin-like metallo-peptidase family M12B [Kineococcus rhizosphaerae]